MKSLLRLVALATLCALAAGALTAEPLLPDPRPTTWANWTIDNGPSTGDFVAVALDSQQRPHMVYHEISPNDSIRYASWVGGNLGNCGPGLAYQCITIATGVGGGGIAVNSVDIALGSDDTPRISYRDHTLANLHFALYVGTAGNCGSGAFLCGIVDGTASNAGKDNSLALDPITSAPRIAYFLDNTLSYAVFGGATGTPCGEAGNWYCQVVDQSSAETGWDVSLALDASGNPHISYWDKTNRDLRFARFVGTGGNCGPEPNQDSWQCDTIDEQNDVGWHTSLALDASGKARIAYLYCGTATAGTCDPGDLKFVYEVEVGQGNCGPGVVGSRKWLCIVVESGAAGASLGQHPVVALDAAGEAHVVHYDQSNGDIRLAYEVPVGTGNCGLSNDWQCELAIPDVAPNGTFFNGDMLDLKLDARGLPHVAYYYCGPGTCASDLNYAALRWLVYTPVTVRQP